MGTIKKKKYKNLKTVFMHIGYPRSGGTLVGSLLDSHPNAIIAQELNPFLLMSKNNFEGLVDRILGKSHKFTFKKGRNSRGYNYMVKNQHNGVVDDENLEVIGIKLGSHLIKSFRIKPNLVNMLNRFVKQNGCDLKFFHVIRNPYDMIATRFLRGNSGTHEAMSDCISETFLNAKHIIDMKKRKFKIHDIRLEDLISSPKDELIKLFNFIDVEISDDFISDCSNLIFDKQKITRNKIKYNRKQIVHIKRNIQNISHFSGYNYKT